MFRRRAGCRVAVCLVATLFAISLAGVAEAGRGFVLWGHGEHITDLGTLPIEVRERLAERDPEVAQCRLGFLYEFVDVFWVDVWTRSGRHVLYAGDSYYELEGELLGVFAGAGGDRLLRVPFGYRVPPGLVVGLVAIGAWVFSIALKHVRVASRAGPSP
jgi:hypothetical protein